MAEIKPNEANSHVRALFEKGLDALKRDNPDYAMDMFETALNNEPRLLQARKHLATTAIKHVTNHRQGKLKALQVSIVLLQIPSLIRKSPIQALQKTEHLLRADPLNINIVKMHCDAAVAADMPEIALSTLHILIKHTPITRPILERLAELCRQIGDIDQEHEHRTAICKQVPTDAAAQKKLKDTAARLTIEKSGWKDAQNFRDVIKKEPNE